MTNLELLNALASYTGASSFFFLLLFLLQQPRTLGLVHYSFYCYFYCNSLVHWGQFIILFIVISTVKASYTGASSFFFLLLFLLQQLRTLVLVHFSFYCYFYCSSLVHWGKGIFLMLFLMQQPRTPGQFIFLLLFLLQQPRTLGLVHFSFYCYFYCNSLVHRGQGIFLLPFFQ